MSRARLIRTSEFPYHIVARANNKEWFYLHSAESWQIFCFYLVMIQEKFGVEIHAFVMMDNHIHLLISTPNENIDQAMHYFFMMTSRTIGKKANRINKIWGNRYYRSLITCEKYYAHVLKYIYRNPVEAGLVEFVQDYKYSTFNKLNYRFNQKLVISDRDGFNVLLPENKIELLEWLNKDVDLFFKEQMKSATKKQILKFNSTRGIDENYFDKFLP